MRKLRDTLNFCVNIVKQSDYENYICTLLAPKSIKTSLFVTKAFNVELSQVLEQATIKETAMMRFLYWNNTLDDIYTFNKPIPNNPIAQCLSHVVQEHKINKLWFKKMIEARKETVNHIPFSTTTALENYLDDTNSTVFYAALDIMGMKDSKLDHVASHVGKAMGLVNFIRAIPFHAQRRRIYVPNDIMIKHKVSHQGLMDWISKSTKFNESSTRTSEAADAILYDLCGQANGHYIKARDLGKTNVPHTILSLFLSLYIVDNFLTKAQNCNFNFRHLLLHPPGKWDRAEKNLLPLKLFCNKMFDMI